MSACRLYLASSGEGEHNSLGDLGLNCMDPSTPRPPAPVHQAPSNRRVTANVLRWWTASANLVRVAVPTLAPVQHCRALPAFRASCP